MKSRMFRGLESPIKLTPSTEYVIIFQITSIRIVFPIVFLFSFVLALSIQESFAQELIGAEISAPAFVALDSDADYIERLRYVRLNDIELGDELSITLFDNVAFSFSRNDEQQHGDVSSWYGLAANASSALLTRHADGTWFGKIVSPKGQYQIRFVGDNSYAVAKVSLAGIDEREDEEQMQQDTQLGFHRMP